MSNTFQQSKRIGGKGLVYETAVAEVRKSAPLKHSVRLLRRGIENRA